MASILLNERGTERVIQIAWPILEIGRGHENQVVISDPRSSRKHCRILQTPQGWILEDLKSRNGTLLNGQPVEREFIRTGDTFHIGKALFRFTAEEGAPEVHGAPGHRDARSSPAAASPGAKDDLGGILEEFDGGPVNAAELQMAETLAVHRPQEPPEGTGCFLEGVEGSSAGQRIPVLRFPFTIGRKKANDLTIHDQRASGNHVRLVRKGSRIFLEDLDSRNGTLVNHKRVREAALIHGALIRIGDTSFRIDLPPSAMGAAEGPEEPVAPVPDAGTHMVAEDDFNRLNARQILRETESAGSPLAVAAILLVLGTLAWFAVDITLKTVRHPDPDPPDPGNSIANWSFEDRAEAGGILGWALEEGSGGRISLEREGAQFPGANALRIVPEGPGLTRVFASRDIPIEPGSRYRLAAHLTNLGAFAAGVSVSWLMEAEDRRVEVGRDWGAAIREEVKNAEEIDRIVIPPQGAVFARVTPFVIAAGNADGGASFDRIFFGSIPEAAPAEPGPGSDADSGEEAEADPVLPVDVQNGSSGPAAAGGAPAGLPIRLQVAADGSLRDLRRGSKYHIGALWIALSGDADPLAIGPRLMTRVKMANDREGVLLVAQLPDQSKGEWHPLETRVASQGSEIQCEFRITAGQAASAAGALKVAVFLETPLTVREITAFGGSLRTPTSFAPEKPDAGAIEELLFGSGSGSEQTALLFRPAVTLRAMPHPEMAGRTLLVAEATLESDAQARGQDTGARTLTLRVSPFSRREEEAAAALLREAGDLHGAGKAPEARECLDGLRRKFPWRTGDLARAESLEKSWLAESERALKSIQEGIEDLRASPAPVVRDAILGRIEGLRPSLRGLPMEKALDDVAKEVNRIVPAAARAVPASPEVSGLTAARTHLDRGEFAQADLFVRLARQGQLTPEEQEEARHLEDLIKERRVQRSLEEVR